LLVTPDVADLVAAFGHEHRGVPALAVRSDTARQSLDRTGVTVEQRHLIVSADSHVSPSMAQLRPYCEQRLLDDFDSFAAAAGGSMEPLAMYDDFDAALYRRVLDTAARPGLYDPDARRRDMDAEGIVTDVIFHGGQNREVMPFVSSDDWSLRATGYRIYNR